MRREAPDPRRRLKDAAGELARGRGDVKSLEPPLEGSQFCIREQAPQRHVTLTQEEFVLLLPEFRQRDGRHVLTVVVMI